jgi:hypothetical protein
MPLTGPTRAAEPVKIEDLTFRSGSSEFKAEGVEFEGLNLSPEALEVLIHGSDRAAQAKALASLDASVIRIARLRETQSLGGQTSTTLFSHFVLSDVRAGVVKSLQADQINFGTIEALGETSAGSIASLVLEDIDLSLILGFGNTTAIPKTTDFKVAYHLARLDTIAIRGTKGPTVTINKVEVRDVRLRDSNEGLSALTERIIRHQASQDPPNDGEMNKMALDVVDLFSAISTGGVDIDGLSIRETEKPENFATLKHFSYSGEIDKPSMYRFDDLDVAVDEFRLKMESLSHHNIKMGVVLEALRKYFSKPNAQPSDVDPVVFTPLIGQFEIKNLAVETNLEGVEHSGVGALRFALDAGPDGIPTSIDLNFDRLTGPLSVHNPEPTVQTLIGLGYRYVNASGGLKISFNSDAKDMTFKANLSAENMAVVDLSAVLGNVSLPALAANPNSAPILLLGSSVKSLQVSANNQGLAERLIDQQSVRTKRTPAEIRSSYASAVAASLQIYFGMSPNAKALTQSVVKFIGKPEKISIVANAIRPTGVSLSDTTSGAGPAAILDLFNFQIEPN